MLRATVAVLLLTLAFVPLSDARPATHVCLGGDFGICAGIWENPGVTCAGVGFGYQGVGVCSASTGCAWVFLGFNDIGTCTLILA